MTTTPKRRWPRFTLRTLFVVVTVACLLIGLAGKVEYARETARLSYRPASKFINLSGARTLEQHEQLEKEVAAQPRERRKPR